MNDEQAAEVQAALDEKIKSYAAYKAEDTYLSMMRYDTAQATIQINADTWLRDLLDERQRLRDIEDLAREWCSLYGVNAEAAQADVMRRLRKALGE